MNVYHRIVAFGIAYVRNYPGFQKLVLVADAFAPAQQAIVKLYWNCD